ncbi:MAG: zinc-ribbon domain-containing protein [Vicinamibacteria bacterium]
MSVQTNCPQCSQKLVVEDDKIPAGPFMLRCPKCQTTLKLPGKAGAAALPPSAPQMDAGSPLPPGNASPSRPQSPEPASTMVPPSPPPAAPATRSEGASVGGNGRALVVLDHQADPSVQSAVGTLLQRNGYGIDSAMEVQQGVHLLERNSYAVVVTTSNGGSGRDKVSLYKRVAALAPEIRRNLFLVLLGNEFSSGDGTQAFSAMADLVLNPKDVGGSEDLLRSTLAERDRIYRSFLEAQARLDRRKY